jgi:cell division topological specificity factor
MSSFIRFFLGQRNPTACVAKERLQIILAHERPRQNAHEPDYLPALQRDLMAVLAKYIKVSPADVQVMLERQGNLDILEVKIELSDK